jgi:hypothetical protein
LWVTQENLEQIVKAPGFKRKVLHVAILTALAVSSAPARSQATWNGGAGDWDDGTKWDSGTAPTSSTDAVVDSDTATDSTVTVDTAAAAQNLTIDSGDQVTVTNGDSVTIHGASIQNDGTLSLGSFGAYTDLMINNPSTSLSGSGVLSLSDSIYNRIRASDDSYLLTNSAGHSILGSGWITDLTLANQGLIATNANGTLILDGVDVTNTGGEIRAAAGSSVRLTDNTSITGGQVSGDGVIDVDSSRYSSSARLTDLTNEGKIELRAFYDGLTLEGTITNTGSIQTTSLGYLHVDDGAASTCR